MEIIKYIFFFQPTHMAEFSQVQSIQTVVGDGGKVLLQLRVAGSQELLQVPRKDRRTEWWTDDGRINGSFVGKDGGRNELIKDRRTFYAHFTNTPSHTKFYSRAQ